MEFHNIYTLLTFIFGGTTLGTIGTLIYTIRKAKYQAEQEGKSLESMSIRNTNDVILLYKKALEDIKGLNQEKEKDLISKLEDQDARIKKQNSEIDAQSKIIKDQTKLLGEMKLVQAKLQLEIDSLKKQLSHDCNSCTFASSCLKKIALDNNK